MSIMYQIPNMPKAEQFINDAILDIRVDMVGTNRQYFFGTTYFHLLLGLRSLEKSEFIKLIISFFHYEKTPIYVYFTFDSKINEFELKKLEKKTKNPKT